MPPLDDLIERLERPPPSCARASWRPSAPPTSSTSSPGWPPRPARELDRDVRAGETGGGTPAGQLALG